MKNKQLHAIVEGALFAAGTPLSLDRLKNLFPSSEQPNKDALKQTISELQQRYKDSAIELKEVASGYTFLVRSQYCAWISHLWEEKPARYSRAVLETLAIIAYRQPVTRGDIENIRGVNVASYTIKTLLEREWIRVVGHRDVPGKPALYATSKQFLDDFALTGIDQLPPLCTVTDALDVDTEQVASQDETHSETVDQAPHTSKIVDQELAASEDLS